MLTLSATTCSRTIWAVSRDNTLPYSHIWMQVSSRFDMPLNAMLLSGVVITVLHTLYHVTAVMPRGH
jgi:choline transport protein